jgi:hypothetical protein
MAGGFRESMEVVIGRAILEARGRAARISCNRVTRVTTNLTITVADDVL